MGAWVIGTPDDLVAAIERLHERSGGIGGLMITATDWAPREAVHRSFELIARHVMPRFQGSLEGIEASNAVARARAPITGEERVAAVEGAQAAYERERGTIR
jgi:limonene 1,2-monooxygenase